MSDLIMNPEGFGRKVYNRFPPRYREDDVQTNYALKRYLDACGDGGFKFSIQEWNGILDFANPDQATPQALPVLYQQYGLDIFYGIPEQYLRYLLPRLGEAWSKKGSLDVIEFVVSALTGIKTITEVSYDQDGNADVDIRLQMDYSMSDYFPDPKQFERLIDKFLPFYLGKTIIYTFVFSESQDLHMDEDHLDRVRYFTNEKGLFVSSGFRPMETTNNPLRLVNDTFITNGWEQFAPIPDVFVDRISTSFHEQAGFDPRWSREYFTSVWNRDKTNTTLYTNRRMETDECRDKIILVPVHEVSHADAEDSRKDHLVIGQKVLYTPMTNTGFVTNSTLYTNDSNVEKGVLKSEDVEDFSVQTFYNEGVGIGSVLSAIPKKTTNNKKQVTNKTFKTNDLYVDTDSHEDKVSFTTNETSDFDGEDRRVDHVKMDTKVMFYPMTNSAFLTNSGFSTNYSNVEDTSVSAEDSKDTIKVKSTVEESATLVVFPYLFTNFLSRGTNQCCAGVPDAFDVVTCKDGTKFGVFSP